MQELTKHSPESRLAEILKQRGESIATAESCTGGNIAHRITAAEGSSQYFMGGVVAYANHVKTDLLNVSAEVIAAEGAVSRSVAEQMAQGVRKACKSTYGIATTGIAGPTGGSIGKPVGTVWIAVATPSGTLSELFHSNCTRSENIEAASTKALEMLCNLLLAKQK